MEKEQLEMAEELLFSGKQRPSFAKTLFFGLFDAERVMPFPEQDPSEKKESDLLLEKLETFLNEKLDPVWIDRNSTIPEEVINGLGDLGILSMTIPKEYGGLGMSQKVYCKAEEMIAGRCGSTALFVNAHQSVGMKALLIYGTEEQKKRWLPSLADGRVLCAFSLTEPNAGSDAAGVQTRAVYDPEKKMYRINGRKQWTTNGSIAGILTVMAQTEIETPKGKKDAITAFLVTPDMEGFHVLDHALDKVGMRGSTTSNLEFRDLWVPEENILGEKGKGLKVALNVLNYGRTTFGATCTGTSKVLLRLATEHAIQRHQFKRPLASFSLVKQKLAMMSALTYAMDATTALTAGMVDKDSDDIMLETAMLKVFASDCQWRVQYEAMQILGGRSFFTDAPYERMMRDARLNMIGEGSNEVMRAFIGGVGMRDVGMQLQELLNAIKHPFGNLKSFSGFIRHWLSTFRTPTIPVRSSLLVGEAQQLGRLVRRFGLCIPRILAKYREAVVEQQLVLDRIATAAMAIYSSSAVISKLDSDLQKVGGKEQALGADVAVAKYYLNYAYKQVEQSLDHLFRNNDRQTEKVADQIVEQFKKETSL